MMINKINRDLAFYVNVTVVGLWHGVSGGYLILFVIAGIMSKASTSVFKADTVVLSGLQAQLDAETDEGRKSRLRTKILL